MGLCLAMEKTVCYIEYNHVYREESTVTIDADKNISEIQARVTQLLKETHIID